MSSKRNVVNLLSLVQNVFCCRKILLMRNCNQAKLLCENRQIATLSCQSYLNMKTRLGDRMIKQLLNSALPVVDESFASAFGFFI